MIPEDQKKEILSMWKNEPNISKISKVTKVSRPTVRKIVNQYLGNRKFWLTRTHNEDDVERFVINTWRQRAEQDGSAVDRLSAGVAHWELRTLLRSFIKSETADQIWNSMGRNPSSICVLHLKKSELIPGADIGYTPGF